MHGHEGFEQFIAQKKLKGNHEHGGGGDLKVLTQLSKNLFELFPNFPGKDITVYSEPGRQSVTDVTGIKGVFMKKMKIYQMDQQVS